MREISKKSARKLRETLLVMCRATPEKSSKIKGFHDFAMTVERVFQDHLAYIVVGSNYRSQIVCEQ